MLFKSVPTILTVFTPPGGGGGTPYNVFYGETLRERSSCFRVQIYKRVGILRVEVYERLGKSVNSVGLKAQKG